MIRNLLWCIFTPERVTYFYQAGHWKIRWLLGTEAALRGAHNAFMQCSKREQEFIVWRDPVFKQLAAYVKELDPK